MINFANLFAPGTASDDSVVLAQQSGDSIFTRHNERDISRLQSAINSYSNLKATYNLNDLVNFEGTNYRNITAVTAAENFDPVKWETLEAALNTVFVKDVSQFPDATPGFFTHVENNGIGDARFLFRDSLVYTNEQIAEITNSTVVAYDGVHTIDKSQIFLNKQYDTVTLTSGERAVVVDAAENIIYSVNGTTNNVAFIDGKTNVKDPTLISVGSVPIEIHINVTAQELYTPNAGGASISVIDINPLSGTYQTVIATISLGAGLFTTFQRFPWRLESDRDSLQESGG